MFEGAGAGAGAGEVATVGDREGMGVGVEDRGREGGSEREREKERVRARVRSGFALFASDMFIQAWDMYMYMLTVLESALSIFKYRAIIIMMMIIKIG